MKIPVIFQPRTLQQRNILFLVLPTLLVLLVMGMGSLLLVRQALIVQWQQTAIARMQTVAHEVDMRLMRPKRLLSLLFQENSSEMNNHHVILQFILDRLKSLEGVVQVNLEWNEGFDRSVMGGMGYRKMKPLEVTTPVYDTEFKGKTVSLVSEFRDVDDNRVGRIEVKIAFFDLVDTMVKASWWQDNRAFLVDPRGNVLTRTSQAAGAATSPAGRFGTGSELEMKTLIALQHYEFGTLFGEGIPPAEVSSYYRLQEAPWTMVVIVPGRVALQSLLKFRNYYIGTIALGMVMALILIRMATGSTVRAIREVSDAAGELARGNIGEPLTEDRLDEVGELTRNFNIMTRHLEERLQLQEAMSVAREVQQNLLPQSSWQAEGIDVSGCSQYCEETGGDYFDLLPDQRDRQRISVVIGDVVGHGIGAALLMASIRAIVRCRTSLPGSPAQVIGDVNELLCRDTEKSGNFVSLFYLIIDRGAQLLRWVRCGHDPAIVYDVASAHFSELQGEGLVLGFDSGWQYRESSMSTAGRELVILLGSDGLWDAENEEGEKFGRERVKTLLAAHSHRSAEEIITSITTTVNTFRGRHPQGDDITLVVAKTAGSHQQ